MRYILATTLLMTVGMTSSASAGCGPAIQNWQNGSKITCTYDSNGGAVETVSAAPAAVPSTPPPPPVEEKCYKDDEYGDNDDGYGDDEGDRGHKSYKSHKGHKGDKGRKSYKSQKQSRGYGGNDA